MTILTSSVSICPSPRSTPPDRQAVRQGRRRRHPTRFVWGDQAGCWQHVACLYDITELIYAAMDRPDWVHALLDILLHKKLQFIETMRGANST